MKIILNNKIRYSFDIRHRMQIAKTYYQEKIGYLPKRNFKRNKLARIAFFHSQFPLKTISLKRLTAPRPQKKTGKSNQKLQTIGMFKKCFGFFIFRKLIISHIKTSGQRFGWSWKGKKEFEINCCFELKSKLRSSKETVFEICQEF